MPHIFAYLTKGIYYEGNFHVQFYDHAVTETANLKIQKEAKIILQQNDIRFNHGIEKSEQGAVNIVGSNSQDDVFNVADVENIDLEVADEIVNDENLSPMFQKTLGGTLYTVYVHFNNASKESFEDKILRMLESEAVNIG